MAVFSSDAWSYVEVDEVMGADGFDEARREGHHPQVEIEPSVSSATSPTDTAPVQVEALNFQGERFAALVAYELKPVPIGSQARQA